MAIIGRRVDNRYRINGGLKTRESAQQLFEKLGLDSEKWAVTTSSSRGANGKLYPYFYMQSFMGQVSEDEVGQLAKTLGSELETMGCPPRPSEGVIGTPKPKKIWTAATGQALLDLLRKAATKAKPTAGKHTRTGSVNYYERNGVIRKAILNRANGVCEYCEQSARYFKKSGEPILEPHHIDLVSQGGADDAWFVAAVHPDCHAAAHRSAIAKEIREKLIAKLTTLRQELMPA